MSCQSQEFIENVQSDINTVFGNLGIFGVVIGFAALGTASPVLTAVSMVIGAAGVVTFLMNEHYFDPMLDECKAVIGFEPDTVDQFAEAFVQTNEAVGLADLNGSGNDLQEDLTDFIRDTDIWAGPEMANYLIQGVQFAADASPAWDNIANGNGSTFDFQEVMADVYRFALMRVMEETVTMTALADSPTNTLEAGHTTNTSDEETETAEINNEIYKIQKDEFYSDSFAFAIHDKIDRNAKIIEIEIQENPDYIQNYKDELSYIGEINHEIDFVNYGVCQSTQTNGVSDFMFN